MGRGLLECEVFERMQPLRAYVVAEEGEYLRCTVDRQRERQ